MSKYISRKVTVFHERELPEEGYLVGYAYIIDHLKKETKQLCPIPDVLSICTEKHQKYSTTKWNVFTTRHAPKEGLLNNLIFALKYEGVDLFVIKKLFQYIEKDKVKELINKEPTSQYSRKIWFLYEWLMQKKISVPDLKKGTYVELINTKHQYAGPSINSTRHRIKNNLPGSYNFCPTVRRTKKIEDFIALSLSEKIEDGLQGKSRSLIKRTAAFLLLKDSKASFAIEGENPPNIRARNWSKIIGQAGKNPLSIKEIERLQDVLIGIKKLKHMGIRLEQGFVGEHDIETFEPIPDHISAKADDLDSLLEGLIKSTNLLVNSDYNPVLAAATIAFGFNFIHPLSDGNGRIHRYLIHHLLIAMGFTKREMIFPVSAAILDRIGEYQEVLEAHSSPRLDLIEWEATENHNVRVLNETIDLYRYYDATRQAEFLFECVNDTIESIIPRELDFLEKYDKMKNYIDAIISMPDTKVDLLIKFLNQNEGRLSKNKRLKDFEELTSKEIKAIEDHFAMIFID
ncbi:MAG: cell filamentation protein Fic [Marinilabiliales bacterium]|nr:MAG: cell filamentation protein Fic [Marinilabiliales bacterium]